MRLASLAVVVIAVVVIELSASSAGAVLGPIRPEFQVSTGPRYSYYGYQYPHNEANFSIDIGASDAGTFVVVWEDIYQYVGNYGRPGIFARRFNTLPNPLGREFRTTPITSYIRGSSHVASDKDGNFVVVWDEYGFDYVNPTDTDGLRIMAQRFNVNAGKVGPPFQVNTFTTDYQYTPKVGFDGAGNFVVVWAYYYDGYAVLSGQKYSPTGTAMGGEFQVNTDTSCCVGTTDSRTRASSTTSTSRATTRATSSWCGAGRRPRAASTAQSRRGSSTAPARPRRINSSSTRTPP